MLRYGYFKQTVQQLIAKMKDCPKIVWVGLNAQADWSPNELRLRRKVFVPTHKAGDAVVPKGGPLPNAWDWRRRGLDKVTPAKDQGRCGSCFAFAAAAAVESKLLIQYNKSYSSYRIDLSEQAIVDCVNAKQGGYMSTGCGGGYLEEPLNYAARCAGVCADGASGAVLRCAGAMAQCCAVLRQLHRQADVAVPRHAFTVQSVMHPHCAPQPGEFAADGS